MKKTIGLLVVAGLSMGAFQAAQAQEGDWEIKLTPYVWGMGLDGDIGGPRGLKAPVDIKFTDAIEDLDFAAMVAGEARNGPWGILADVAYMDLSDEASTPAGKLDVGVEQWIIQGSALYRVHACDKMLLDVGAGFRSMELDSDISIGGLDGNVTENWVDPLFVARVRQQFGPNCFGVLMGDIGGFDVASDLTWQVTAAAGYSLNETVSMFLAYRYLDYDYDDDGAVYDVAASGLGFGLQFDL